MYTIYIIQHDKYTSTETTLRSLQMSNVPEEKVKLFYIPDYEILTKFKKSNNLHTARHLELLFYLSKLKYNNYLILDNTCKSNTTNDILKSTYQKLKNMKINWDVLLFDRSNSISPLEILKQNVWIHQPFAYMINTHGIKKLMTNINENDSLIKLFHKNLVVYPVSDFFLIENKNYEYHHNIKYIIISIVCLLFMCGLYYFVSNSNRKIKISYSSIVENAEEK